MVDTHVSAISGGAGGGGGLGTYKNAIASLKYISQLKFFKVRYVIDSFSCFSFDISPTNSTKNKMTHDEKFWVCACAEVTF